MTRKYNGVKKMDDVLIIEFARGLNSWLHSAPPPNKEEYEEHRAHFMKDAFGNVVDTYQAMADLLNTANFKVDTKVHHVTSQVRTIDNMQTAKYKFGQSHVQRAFNLLGYKPTWTRTALPPEKELAQLKATNEQLVKDKEALEKRIDNLVKLSQSNGSHEPVPPPFTGITFKTADFIRS